MSNDKMLVSPVKKEHVEPEIVESALVACAVPVSHIPNFSYPESVVPVNLIHNLPRTLLGVKYGEKLQSDETGINVADTQRKKNSRIVINGGLHSSANFGRVKRGMSPTQCHFPPPLTLSQDDIGRPERK